MEANQEKEPLRPSDVIKSVSQVLVPGDDVTIKFKCNKFAFLELVVREIHIFPDSSLIIDHE